MSFRAMTACFVLAGYTSACSAPIGPVSAVSAGSAPHFNLHDVYEETFGVLAQTSLQLRTDAASDFAKQKLSDVIKKIEPGLTDATTYVGNVKLVGVKSNLAAMMPAFTAFDARYGSIGNFWQPKASDLSLNETEFLAKVSAASSQHVSSSGLGLTMVNSEFVDPDGMITVGSLLLVAAIMACYNVDAARRAVHRQLYDQTCRVRDAMRMLTAGEIHVSPAYLHQVAATLEPSYTCPEARPQAVTAQTSAESNLGEPSGSGSQEQQPDIENQIGSLQVPLLTGAEQRALLHDTGCTTMNKGKGVAPNGG